MGELCEINPETIAGKQLNEINYIDISCVKTGKILEIKNLKDNFPSRAKRLLKVNDIIYSTVRPNLKGYAFVKENLDNLVASTGFAVIRLKKNINLVIINYIYYNIILDEFNKYLISKCNGSNYPSFNSSEFVKIKIKVPKNKQLITDLESKFQEIEQCQENVKTFEQQYEQKLKDLYQAAVKEIK